MEYTLAADEQKIYITLAQAGPMSIMELHKQTGMYRPVIYRCLDAMKSAGLVREQASGKRRVYTVTSQRDLEHVLSARVAHIEQENRNLLDMAFGARRMVRIKNGQDIRDMYMDLVHTLGEQEPYYSLGTCTDTWTFLQYLSDEFRRLREKKNLWSYVIATTVTEYRRFSLAIKFFDAPAVEKDCLWMSYADRIVYIDFRTTTGYIIYDMVLARFTQGILHAMYKMLPEGNQA